MKKKIIIIIVLAISVAAVIIVKDKKQQTNSIIETKNINQSTKNVDDKQSNLSMTNHQKRTQLLPRLVDLGADKCMACKAMEPVLEKLREEYKGKLQVDFIDVWKNPKEAEKYKIKSIPTQIFFDTNGKEIYRHIGFISEEDILKRFEEKGVLN